MKIEILTLFPEACMAMLNTSIIGRGIANGLLTISCHQIRDYTVNKQGQVDDYTYGGGNGMLMQADPLYRCWRAVCDMRNAERIHTVLMAPTGAVFNQIHARRLLTLEHIILVCGHYEGVDQRFIDECVDEELSIGDFVLSGGEIPAAAIADAVCRLVPGVLSDTDCFTEESHWAGLLEYPQYSRPVVWHDRPVPDVLLSGHHANIVKWRHEQAVIRTYTLRPDMIENAALTKDDLLLIEKVKKDKEIAKEGKPGDR